MSSLADLTDVEGALVGGGAQPPKSRSVSRVLSPHSHVSANNNSFTIQ